MILVDQWKLQLCDYRMSQHQNVQATRTARIRVHELSMRQQGMKPCSGVSHHKRMISELQKSQLGFGAKMHRLGKHHQASYEAYSFAWANGASTGYSHACGMLLPLDSRTQTMCSLAEGRFQHCTNQCQVGHGGGETMNQPNRP